MTMKNWIKCLNALTVADENTIIGMNLKKVILWFMISNHLTI